MLFLTQVAYSRHALQRHPYWLALSSLPVSSQLTHHPSSGRALCIPAVLSHERQLLSSSSQPVLPKYKIEEILNPRLFQIMVAFNDITVTVLSVALDFLHMIAFGIRMSLTILGHMLQVGQCSRTCCVILHNIY